MRTSKKRFEIRKNRIRTKIAKVGGRPRLSIYKSNKHIFGQVVGISGEIIASASTLEKEMYLPKKNMCNKLFASKIGSLVASRALEQGIKDVVFDRGGYKYHGVVAVFADAARDSLKF